MKGRSILAGVALLLLAGMPGTIDRQAGAQQGPAQQELPASGVLTARALKQPQQAVTVYVSPYDDNELNLTLKSEFESQLAAQGKGQVTPRAAAGFLLLFEAEVVPAEQVERDPSLGSARVSGGLGGDPAGPDESREAEVDVNVNVWSSSKDSVLGGRRSVPEIGSSYFHINAILRRRDNSAVVWEGNAYHVLPDPQTERVARGMVAPLVGKIGQSVVRETFEID